VEQRWRSRWRWSFRPGAGPSPPGHGGRQHAGFDDVVRAAYSTGNAIWVGGFFDNQVQRDPGPAVAIAALDPVTGGKGAGITPPALGGTNPVVYDFSLSPSGVLYAAGVFTYMYEGQTYRNLVGLNPSTGAVVQPFSTQALLTVFATNDRIFAGGSKLWAYNTDGTQVSGFTPLTPAIDTTLRGHETLPQFRDIGVADDGYGIAVGQFDFINGVVTKVAVKFDVNTGARQSWNVSNLTASRTAFGIELELVGPVLYVGAGGSDFTVAYQVSDGKQIWRTDTSGSSQAVALWDANTLIVGGHFQWVAYGNAVQCGSNNNPNTACLNQPRLVAMNAQTGAVIDRWRPDVCGAYNGIWTAITAGGKLHVGGAFTKIGGVTQRHYARFSDAGSEPPPSTSTAFSDGFETGGFTKWNQYNGLQAQTSQVHTGAFAARNSQSTAWALKQFSSSSPDLYVRVWVQVEQQTDAFQVLRVKKDANQIVAALIVQPGGKLRVRNALTATNTNVGVSLHAGWNDLQMHVLMGAGDGRIEVWLDRTNVGDLVGQNAGSNGLNAFEIGNRTTGKIYTADYDDVAADVSFIA
jgi:hypothetical protein